MARESALVGTGFAEQCKEVGKRLRLDYEQNHQARENERIATEAKAQTGKHEYHVIVSRSPKGFVQVETIEEFPLVGRLGAVGRSYQSAIVELRMAYAYELYNQKLIPNFDDARRYTLRCDFVPDLTLSTHAPKL